MSKPSPALEKLQAHLRDQGLDAVLVPDLVNIRYLVGFTGSNGILALTAEGAHFVTDSRYTTQSAQEVKGASCYTANDIDARVAAILEERQVGYVGVELEQLNVKRHGRLERLLSEARLVDLSGAVTALRLCKSRDELAGLRAAAALSEEALLSVVELVRPGEIEHRVATEFHVQTLRLGADNLSFDTIVAGGERAALPHANPGTREFREGDLVVVDFGVVLDGYCSDQTVTLPVGDIAEEDAAIYQIVYRAQRAALDKVREGESLKAIDAAARDLIAKEGYADYFGHGTGHGVGLEVHEAPRVSFQTNDFAREAMVITIEPGIYLPGRLGVRLEDTVWVGKEGYEPITTLPKELGALG